MVIFSTYWLDVSIESTWLTNMSIFHVNIDMFEVYVDFVDTFVTCVEKQQIFDTCSGN